MKEMYNAGKPACEGKVALITGAAGSGMGRSIALTLAREGASVVVNYRASQESADAIVKHIEQAGGKGLSVQADVFQALDCRKLVGAAVDRFGQIDICVIGPGGGWHPEPIDQLVAEGVLEDIHNEVAPITHLLPLVLPGMYQREWGRIIAIAMHPDKPSPAFAYNLAKAARLKAMLLASEQAWLHGVTANIIAPGPVSPLKSLDEAIEHCKHDAQWQARADISPQDIAEGVAFLCSESGRFVTGCIVPYLFHG
jgi:3-oxoacyl-[acyl-carrier protein] reductase